MPILSQTSPNALNNNNENSNSNSTVLVEEKCLVPCKHNETCLKPAEENQVEPMTTMEDELLDNHATSPVQQKRQKKSLVSRNEDDYWVDISDKRLRNSRLGALYDGSRFKGVQKCGTSKYNVLVDIQYVDLKESKISGYLNIEGLTNECPELTTFFEGEIIGPQYSFLTRKWQAQQYIDQCHWGKFPSFEPYFHTFNDDDFTYDPLVSDFIYMRWKEHFLVPDHRVSNIDGASFAGFYYICYQRSTNEIKGFYFYHNNQEWYQQLILEHVEERSFGNFEFR